MLQHVPPPLLFLLTFLVGLGVEWLAPLSPAWLSAEPLRWLGWLLIAAGLAIGIASALMFRRAGTTIVPGAQPTSLVTSGPFAFSRNPMYLSATIIHLGAVPLFGTLWPLILLVVPLALVNALTIPPEERRLLATFGAAYADYCRRVRRWL